MEQNGSILLVDDEDDILEFLGYNLRREGYTVHTAKDGLDAFEKAKEILPQLVILDIMMPRMDGIEACRLMRREPSLSKILIMFLTARSEDYKQIEGLESGADDYINKTVKPAVLLSKVKAMFRRVVNSTDDVNNNRITLGELVIDRERYIIIHRGREIVLPRKEFELLLLLTSKPGKVFSREEIFHIIWGNKVIVGDRTIDVHIRKLRELSGISRIVTVKGVGYKFEL
ncbi:MAG: response regulator transcription factor [Bacteroidota bacterium]